MFTIHCLPYIVYHNIYNMHVENRHGEFSFHSNFKMQKKKKNISDIKLTSVVVFTDPH